MDNKEILFESGESNSEVVRVGDTVRRALTERFDFVHRLMNELKEKNFELSPTFLGVDKKNREIISYIPGTQMNKGEITLDLMKQSMKALRLFHDILAVSELRGERETVIHTDFAPWNMIVDKGQLVGIIDFDDAIPGERIKDIVYACWNLLDIGDLDSEYSEKNTLNLLPELFDAYGDIDRKCFVDELLNEQRRILKKRRKKMKQADNKEERVERRNVCKEIRKQISWVSKHRGDLEKVLKN